MRVTPGLTVDCIITDGESVVLIKRKKDPFKGMYALPGGYVEIGETVEAACYREMKEETSLDLEEIQLVGIYSDPNRDPRRHNVSVVYFAKSDMKNLEAGDDAAEVELVKDWREIDMAFDHKNILEDAQANFLK